MLISFNSVLQVLTEERRQNPCPRETVRKTQPDGCSVQGSFHLEVGGCSCESRVLCNAGHQGHWVALGGQHHGDMVLQKNSGPLKVPSRQVHLIPTSLGTHICSHFRAPGLLFLLNKVGHQVHLAVPEHLHQARHSCVLHLLALPDPQ